ncbi:MAG: Uma2 family endonuclease, partial [Anaerolineae bacterium]|nr:Uma2 family endonuclease [Anaerolineae bacterium]
DDLNRKRRYYRENGVREYWIVNPFAHTVTVCDLANDAETEYKTGQAAVSTLPALDGLRVDVGKLFAAS